MAGTTNATRKKRFTDADICRALTAAGGMIYHAAAKLGCEPSTIYRRRDTSPQVAQAIEDARGEFLDDAETALKAAVKAGEGWAVCFTLKTRGKERGYVERQEISGPDGGPVVTKVTIGYDDGDGSDDAAGGA